MNTPPAIPTPIASQMRIAISTDIRSFSPREPALECRERDVGRRDRPVRRTREVVRERRPGDEGREMRPDRGGAGPPPPGDGGGGGGEPLATCGGAPAGGGG